MRGKALHSQQVSSKHAVWLCEGQWDWKEFVFIRNENVTAAHVSSCWCRWSRPLLSVSFTETILKLNVITLYLSAGPSCFDALTNHWVTSIIKSIPLLFFLTQQIWLHWRKAVFGIKQKLWWRKLLTGVLLLVKNAGRLCPVQIIIKDNIDNK